MFGAIEVKGGGFQYMESLAYTLKANSLKLLKAEEVPAELISALSTLKNQQYPTQSLFLAALKSVADEGLVFKYQDVILKHAETAGKFNGDSYKEFLQQLPNYNPIEKLWKNTKRDATHLKYFKTFEELRNSVIETFRGYMEDASKVVCVMRKLREDSGLSA